MKISKSGIDTESQIKQNKKEELVNKLIRLGLFNLVFSILDILE